MPYNQEILYYSDGGSLIRTWDNGRYYEEYCPSQAEFNNATEYERSPQPSQKKHLFEGANNFIIQDGDFSNVGGRRHIVGPNGECYLHPGQPVVQEESSQTLRRRSYFKGARNFHIDGGSFSSVGGSIYIKAPANNTFIPNHGGGQQFRAPSAPTLPSQRHTQSFVPQPSHPQSYAPDVVYMQHATTPHVHCSVPTPFSGQFVPRASYNQPPQQAANLQSQISMALDTTYNQFLQEVANLPPQISMSDIQYMVPNAAPHAQYNVPSDKDREYPRRSISKTIITSLRRLSKGKSRKPSGQSTSSSVPSSTPSGITIDIHPPSRPASPTLSHSISDNIGPSKAHKEVPSSSPARPLPAKARGKQHMP